MDLDYDLSCAFHTPEILERKIRMLAEHGFERLLIVAPPPGNPDYSHAARVLSEDGPPNFLRQSRNALGDDPLELAVKYAKLAGLEVIIEFKPYEGGGVFTIPDGAIPHCGRNYMETLGGRSVGLDPFILEHPEFLLERKPCDDLRSKPVNRIELVFVLDKIDDGDGMKQISFDDNAVSMFPAREFQIHISSDNGTYIPYGEPFEIAEHVALRTVTDANGEPVFPSPVRCRIIEIYGLKIESPYFSICFRGDEKAFRTIPFSMCTVFSVDSKLTATVSPTVRNDVSVRQLPFNRVGFEFEEVGPYYWDCGWRSCTILGFARGRMKHLRGSLCEAYPEVRKYWLQQISNFIAMGVDGVEVRLQSHCSGVTDFVNYGFNPPLAEAYLEKYAADILAEPCDPIKLMQIRGRFFEMFIQDAKKLLLRNKRKLLIQLHACMEKPSLSPVFHKLGFWANAKILPDWRRLIELADEVVIKDYNFGEYSIHVADEIKNFAAEKQKPLWVHCYLQQGHDWNSRFLNALNSDSRVTGILLYEVVWNKRENDGIIRLDSDGKLHWMMPENI